MRPRGFVDNPPWVTKIVAQNYDLLREKVKPAYMPVFEDAKATRRGLVVEVPELGCGSYGCVLPTDDPTVVLKITTDRTEFGFVTDILPRVNWHEGVVRYHAALELDGKHDGRAVFALWRESAHDIGELYERLPRAEVASFDLLVNQKMAAEQAYVLLSEARDPHALFEQALAWRRRSRLMPVPTVDKVAALREPHVRLAACLTIFRICVAQLAKGGMLGKVGQAMVALADAAVVVADVHQDNVGRVVREGVSSWVITDPGNVMVLPVAWPT